MMEPRRVTGMHINLRRPRVSAGSSRQALQFQKGGHRLPEFEPQLGSFDSQRIVQSDSDLINSHACLQGSFALLLTL